MSTTKKKTTAVVQKTKILIVDDHPVVRKGLWSCLSSKPDLQIVGEACDGNEAIRKVQELQPDVVLMDVQMPQMDGLQVTEALRKATPKVKVLILSMQSNRESVLRIIKAGARGYVLKDAPTEELMRAIEAVNSGEAFFSPHVAQIALNQYVSETDKGSPLAKLSEREREVLGLIAEGKSNKEIAMHLGIGVRTIETHRERIMRKLNIHSIAGLTKFAIANGIVSLEEDANRGLK
ncbi:MAG: response regulator transcription factor [Verrucomicrobiae bacterium]|nr:response regulator transcription factor [Verrucomicrobiae bacterium]